MSLRDKHVFQFTGLKLAVAAEAEARYHRQRETWWVKELKKAVVRAKKKGVEVQEYPVTGGIRANLVLDPTLQGRISECGNKRDSHRTAAQRFHIQSLAYRTAANRVFELDPDDVVYFRLAGGVRED